MTENIIMTVQPAKIIHDSDVEPYTGAYTVIPSAESNTILETSGKYCTNNITVLKYDTDTYAGEYTITPSFEDNIVLATSGKQCTDNITILKAEADTYDGTYTVKSSSNGAQTLATKDKVCTDDITVERLVLQEKTVAPSGISQEITADNEYDALSSVTVEAAPLQTTTATPTTSSQTIEPTAPNIGFSSVTVNPIPPEYIIPSGTINITQNSTVDVSQYATAAVNVPPDTQQVDALIDRSITTVDSNVTAVGAYAFAYCQNLNYVNIPLAATIGESAFFQCTQLTSLSLPNCTSIGRNSVSFCTLLENFSAPLLSTITGQDAFTQSRALTSITLPELTEVPSYTFDNCISLQTADFSKISSIGTAAFRNSISFNTLILRGSSLVALADVNVFSGTCFASSQTATLYVPQALISTYQNDATWSSLLSISGNQILQIEGSPYDNA